MMEEVNSEAMLFQGVLRSIGVSNYDAQLLQEVADLGGVGPQVPAPWLAHIEGWSTLHCSRKICIINSLPLAVQIK